MEKEYIVLEHPGFDGIERLRDPLPRILYRVGMVIRLDSAIDNVAGMKAMGILADVPAAPEPGPPEPIESVEPRKPRRREDN